MSCSIDGYFFANFRADLAHIAKKFDFNAIKINFGFLWALFVRLKFKSYNALFLSISFISHNLSTTRIGIVLYDRYFAEKPPYSCCSFFLVGLAFRSFWLSCRSGFPVFPDFLSFWPFTCRSSHYR
jgi:hypothetical protein